MKTDSSIAPVVAAEYFPAAGFRSPSWGAIIAGLVAAMGVHFLLLMLGMAAGMGAAEPASDANPAAAISLGAAAVWSISALISMWVGGWVAGRCAVRVHSVSGGVHGFLVWCLATLITLFLVASGAGKLVGGTAQIVGQGLAAVGQAAGGLGDVARMATEQNTAMVDSFIDEAAQSGGNRSPAQIIAARREVGQAVRQLFAEDGNLRDPEARAEVVEALQRGAGVPEAEANRMVDSWVAAMERARVNLEEAQAAAAAKAREIADQSADALAKAATWMFIGFLLGAIVSILAGRTGARWEYSHTELADDPTFDPAHRRAHSRVQTTAGGTA